MTAPAPRAEFSAQLELVFARAATGETYLSRQYATFPFHVTQSLALDTRPDGMATVMLQSLGAGLLQGDRIAITIEAGEGAEAHVATQGSTVAHAMARQGAGQHARLVVRPGAWLDYLPRPMILFPAARVTTTLEIELHAGGTALWCDGFLSHDPQDAGGRFDHLAAETLLRDGEGRALALDRFEIGGEVLADVGAIGGHAVHASFGLAGHGADAGLASSWLAALKSSEGVYGGVSRLPHETGLFCRLLAVDGIALRGAIVALWRATRRHVHGVDPAPRP